MRGHDVHHEDMFDGDPMLAAFARDLQDAAAATPAPAIGEPLAAILEGRAPATVYPNVVEVPRARAARRPARLRWAVGAAAFTLGAGSLGVAGALPGPVQRQVSRMAEVIGVHLPSGEGDARRRPTPTTPAPTATTPSTVVVPPRPSVVPANDRPVPSTGPEDPSNRGNREGRGRGDDERSSGQRPAPAADIDDATEDIGDQRSATSDAGDDVREDGSSEGAEDEAEDLDADRSGQP